MHGWQLISTAHCPFPTASDSCRAKYISSSLVSFREQPCQTLSPRSASGRTTLASSWFGIAPAVQAGTWDRLDEWLARGFAGEMKYIERRKEAYRHPSSMCLRYVCDNAGNGIRRS